MRMADGRERDDPCGPSARAARRSAGDRDGAPADSCRSPGVRADERRVSIFSPASVTSGRALSNPVLASAGRPFDEVGRHRRRAGRASPLPDGHSRPSGAPVPCASRFPARGRAEAPDAQTTSAPAFARRRFGRSEGWIPEGPQSRPGGPRRWDDCGRSALSGPDGPVPPHAASRAADPRAACACG